MPPVDLDEREKRDERNPRCRGITGGPPGRAPTGSRPREVSGGVRRVAVAFVLLVLCVPLGTVTTGTTVDGGAGHSDVGIDVTVHRQGGELVYRFEFDVPGAVGGLYIEPYAGEIVTVRGFERPSDASRELAWDGVVRDPSVTVLQDLSAAECPCVVTDDIAMVRPLRVRFRVVDHRGWTTAHLTDLAGTPTVSSSVAVEDGRFLDGLVAVGETTVATGTTVTGERVRVVAPVDARRARAGVVADRIVAAAPLFDVGRPDAQGTTVVVLPDAPLDAPGVVTTWRGSRGVATPNGDVYVREDTGPGTWLHEYVHTRQSFSTAPDMRWFPEATAEYYGLLLADRTDPATDDRDRLERRFGAPRAGGVLADTGTWGSVYVPYDRGGRLIWYLDGRIREETDDRRTFMSVLQRLDGRHGLTLSDLRTAVSEVVGSRVLDEEIVRYATTDRTIPTNRTAFEVSASTAGPPSWTDGSSGPPVTGTDRLDSASSRPKTAVAVGPHRLVARSMVATRDRTIPVTEQTEPVDLARSNVCGRWAFDRRAGHFTWIYL